MAEILNVGDVIYTTQYGTSYTEYIISRVTPTTAISGSKTFVRECDGRGFFKIKGAAKWGPYSATRETEDIRHRKAKQRMQEARDAVTTVLGRIFSESKNTEDCEAKTEKLKRALLLLSE